MSHYDKYTYSAFSSDATVFNFTSKGPKGEIQKTIQFNATNVKNVFNLSFGNILADGSIDDTTANDNKDRNKILATVAEVVQDFTNLFSKSYIFFTGSTPERTRLYRMAITINYEELDKIFDIWSLTETQGFVPFRKGLACSAFLIKRK